MTRNQAEGRVRAMVGAIRRSWVARQVGWLVFASAAGALGWLLVMIVADNLAILSPAQLLIGWGLLLAGAAAWLATIGFTLTVGKPGPDRFALMYESRVPGQHNRLINSLQFVLHGQSAVDPMARATVLENAEHIDVGSASAAVDKRCVRRSVAAAVVCGLLLGAYAMLWPDFAGNAAARLISPLDPPMHRLATEIRVTPGDQLVLEGSPVVIEATLGRRLPERAYLEYRLGELAWTTVELTRRDAAHFGYDGLSAVTMPIRYRVRAGRSASRTFRIDVRYRPRVEALQVSVTRPAYAGGATARLEPQVGDVTGLSGSAVRVAVTANNRLARAHLEMSAGRDVPLTIDAADARKAAGSFLLTESGSYAVRMTDAADVHNLNPARYTITVNRDQAPVVLVTRPGRDLIVPADADVDVLIEAGDDIGLGGIVLQARTAKGKWQDCRRWAFPQHDLRETAVQAVLSLPAFGVRANDTLLYQVIACDKRQPEPNRTVGRTWSITAAEASKAGLLLGAQQMRLLDQLNRILAMQKENRNALETDAPVQSVRVRQTQVRDLTLDVVDDQRKALRPTVTVVNGLTRLAGGAMLTAVQWLVRYEGPADAGLKGMVLKQMDYIIAELERIIRETNETLDAAQNVQEAMEKMTPQQRAALVEKIRDEIKRLKEFIAEEDKAIQGVEELARKADDLTQDDKKEIEKIKGVQDEWAKIFKGKVKDIEELAKQDFTDSSIANDYKELVEHIEEASRKLGGELMTIKTGADSSLGSAKRSAEQAKEKMEMWLPAGPDNTKWIMDNPAQKIEVPKIELPKELFDLIGELVEDQDALNDAAEDETSGNVTGGANAEPTWGVSGGPISSFGAQGKTGNQLPDDNQIGGQSGDGRAGKSQGQAVEDVAKGLPGRKPQTGITNDPYEEGVIKELQKLATGGATGGGKGRGSGQEGLEGESPPPQYGGMEYMKDWLQRMRQKERREAAQLKMIRMNLPSYDEVLDLMRKPENTQGRGRYEDLAKSQQFVLRRLQSDGNLEARPTYMRVDQAYNLPPEQRQKILDAIEEPVPEEYNAAVKSYLEALSENK